MKDELAINKIGQDLAMKKKQLILQKKLRLADTLTKIKHQNKLEEN